MTFLVSFFMRGTIASVSTGYKIYLQQIQDAGITKAWMFGYLFALSRLFAAVMSKTQSRSDLKYGIRSMAGFIILAVMSFFVLSGLLLSSASSYFAVIVISFLFSLLYGIRPAVMILMNKYSNDYNRAEDIDSAMSKKMLFEYCL